MQTPPARCTRAEPDSATRDRHLALPRKSLTVPPDELSGKGPTKRKCALLSGRFSSTQPALANCEKNGICSSRRNGRSAFGSRVISASQTRSDFVSVLPLTNYLLRRSRGEGGPTRRTYSLTTSICLSITWLVNRSIATCTQ